MNDNDLEKELKEQLVEAGIYCDGDCDEDKCEHIHITLSKLIEACGASFHSLVFNIHEWRANGINAEFGRGKTPEEAVKNLHEALNKK